MKRADKKQYNLIVFVCLCHKKLCLSLFLILFCYPCCAQHKIGIKYFGISIHPKGEHENAVLMPNKFDKNGYVVANIGLQLTYAHFIYKDKYALKFAQSLYADCATRLGGFTHLGLRARIFKIKKHLLRGGLGPTLVYRRNWLELDKYVNKNRFKGEKGQKWQYLFLWYGGEFEYIYQLNEGFEFSLSFVPGYPDLMNLSFGLNYLL